MLLPLLVEESVGVRYKSGRKALGPEPFPEGFLSEEATGLGGEENAVHVGI